MPKHEKRAQGKTRSVAPTMSYELNCEKSEWLPFQNVWILSRCMSKIEITK